jgi:hypothetical protein
MFPQIDLLMIPQRGPFVVDPKKPIKKMPRK